MMVKDDGKGVTHMCRIMEEIKAEGVAEGENKGKTETAIKNAIRMLKDGLQIEKISQYTELPVEKIEELAYLIAD